MAAGLPVLVNQAALVVPGFAASGCHCDAGLVTDNSRVSDHHAILSHHGNPNADLAALPSGERDILFLVSGRLSAPWQSATASGTVSRWAVREIP
jgi:DNA topoisomerase-3